MSARRALPDGFELVDDSLTPLDVGVARRAMAEQSCRRALIETEPGTTARRALIEPDDDLQLTETVPSEAVSETSPDSLVAFAERRRKITRRPLLAAVSLVAVAGSVAGVALSGSAAMNAAPSVTGVVAAVVNRQNEDVNRTEERVELLSPSPEQSGTTAAQDIAGTETVDVPGQPATEPASLEPAVTQTAPGQAAPLSVAEAMARAASMVGNQGYNNMCLSLVAAFYGYSSAGEVGAQQAAATIIAAGQMHTDMTNIPVGALIWYDGTPRGNPYGHVAMYAGNGMVYSNGAPTGVGLIPLREPADGWGEPLIGWSSVWLPSATK